MVRSSLAFVVGLFAVASAAGNGLPPPTPGKRFVPTEHVITTEKTYPEYDFYLVTGAPKKVEFGPDSPVKIDSDRPRGKGVRIQFIAVTKGAAEKYADPAAFSDALHKGTVPGQAATKNSFLSPTEIDASDKSRKTTVTHVVERIDAKEGIVFRAAAEKAVPPGKAAPEPPGPRGGGVVAGLAVALAMGFAGLRLARRKHV